MSEARDFMLPQVQRRSLGFAMVCAGLLMLAACQTPSPAPIATTVSPSGPAALPVAAAVYSIRAELSDVRFLVYRAGPLARFGHSHVVRATAIAGEIRLAADFPRSSFALAMPVADFLVDDREARSVEGEEFSTPPDAEAIAGTRVNMLGSKVLEAERFPVVGVESVGLSGPSWAPDVTVRIRLRGVERDIKVPVAIDARDDRLTATSVFEIRLTDFGIAPLSVLGGALQVGDVVKVRLRIVAVKN